MQSYSQGLEQKRAFHRALKNASVLCNSAQPSRGVFREKMGGGEWVWECDVPTPKGPGSWSAARRMEERDPWRSVREKPDVWSQLWIKKILDTQGFTILAHNGLGQDSNVRKYRSRPWSLQPSEDRAAGGGTGEQQRRGALRPALAGDSQPAGSFHGGARVLTF